MITLAQSIVAQVDATGPQERFQALQQYFDSAGDVAGFFGVIVVVAGIAAAAYLLWRSQRQSTGPERDDPQALFRHMLIELGVTGAHRDVLQRMAAELRTEHPTTWLLGERIFSETSRAWQQTRRRKRPTDKQLLDEIHRRLFPAM